MLTDPTEQEDFLFPPTGTERAGHDRLIPMINMVFLLLTFFLITGVIRAGDAVPLEPPEAVTAGELAPHSLAVQISADGQFALDGERLERDMAIRKIKAVVLDTPDMSVEVTCDRATPVSILLPFMKAVSEAGILKLKIVVIRKLEG